MAFDKDQREFPLPGGSNDRRRSSSHLPRYFRTQVNNKFLSSTFDQLIQPGVTEKLNGYLGRKTAPGYSADNFYVGDVSKAREDYQLEPAAVVKDDLDNVQFYGDYNDYLNQIKNLGGSVNDHSLLNRQEYYSWDPHIDWDKFVNFREYYWLPNGPQPVPVSGDKIQIQSTYTVTSQDNLDNYAFVFSPDGLTQNPELTLYRGTTYRFEIDSPGIPISFRSIRTTAAPWSANTRFLDGETVVFESQIYTANQTHRSGETFEQDRDLWSIDTSLNLVNEVSQQGVEKGVIELTLFPDSPDFIYYVSDADINAGGLIRVYNEEEASFIDVEDEIIGKRTYTAGDGFDLSNGMKIYFQGTTAQEKYQQGSWYVEGVGSSITLISEDDLNISSDFVEDEFIDFDSEGFDTVPYSRAIGFPREKDYFTINRSSQDGNLWSTYNRWFHRDVIDKSAEINRTERVIDQNARAFRPIIEFEAGIKLFDFGTSAKQSVDLVDDFTRDVFSTIEGSEGYNIDGVDITNGMRILFTADEDIRVRGKIYRVEFITFKGQRQIALRETDDADPLDNETVLCKQGDVYLGKILYFTDSEWRLAQQKESVNQEPLFDVFDCDGNSLADPEVYQSSSFTGTRLFSYGRGQGTNDPELGFPLSYRNIQNVGDIVFNFNLTSDAITYCPDDSETLSKSTGIGYLKQFKNRETFDYLNGWKKAETLSEQLVVRQYEASTAVRDYPIDVYDNSAELTDLNVKVYVNNSFQILGVDYNLEVNAKNESIVRFVNPLSDNDVIQIKTKSSAVKNENGKYEIAINLERNPLNDDIQQLTLGEINDHVGTIVEDVAEFQGAFPGLSNLRDQGSISQYGKRIVKHSAPLNLALYHMLDEKANLVKALKYSRQQYGQFKRNFLQTAFDLAFDGPTNKHFDRVMRQITKEKPDTDPFYFSDMIATGAKRSTTFEIDSEDQQFFGLTALFDLESPSEKSVLVYLNGIQLIHGEDYTFNDEGFVVLSAEIERGDELVIDEFESTNGSFVPATPTKLGLYPKFIPQKFVDDTYIEPKTVIQGHDGSIMLAFDDFRDELILELEKRIYNNIKVEYDSSLFDILDYVPSQYRDTGITKEQIDQTIISDFVQWTRLIDEDYTENKSYDRDNSFTWNYTGSSSFDGVNVQGRWRQIYKAAYDTDRPHSRPWEMLGYSIKPDWWDEQYGEAPYTSNNLLMWEDLEQGIVREPGKNFKQVDKYRRPGLVAHLPVDETGNLLSPLQSNYIRDYNTTEMSQDFVYGDWSPIETAWRKSSEYPFALLTSLFINQPARTMSVCFDRTRQQRGLVDDIIYEKPNRQIRLQDVVFPNSIQDDERIFTAGFVNYIRDYISSNVTSIYETYKENLRNIDNQIGAKLAGYTTKDKFKLILDSRTPLNEGNVFVPEENYQIFLNTSTPVKTVYYSGVIVEKQGKGFVVRGYNEQHPYFEYNPPRKRNKDPIITVGGISASTTDWVANRTLTSGTIVEFRNNFYRVVVSHVSGESFDEDKFVKLPQLPIEGGQEAHIRQEFLPTTEIVTYGTVLKTIQDVVDFILGYGNWLETQGFVFDFYDGETGLVADWITATKEYLFWTTQNWSEGSVISLSPAAFKLKVESENSVVGDIYDTFYGYSLLKVDGKKFQPEFVSLTREEPGEFEIKPKNTEDGIFGVRVAFVQKEHALIIDNRTQFGDVIYDQPAGYRQERIKVLGYRTAEWDGSINVPGFIFDEVKIEDWQPWRDYAIGDLVRYKEFFYAARNPVAGSSVFVAEDWIVLSERPEGGLIPNFEYKTNQFADFYDLDSDNFDSEQQKFAQHLIGYQNRDYLANIINDDVSQYKFYQGFIQDKGTANAFTKLFDALGSANRDSLEFYEEWAIKSGQYGAADGFEEVEYLLDESQFKTSPQPVKLTDLSSTGTDLIYRILPNEVYLKPRDYNHAPFPEKIVTDTFVKNSGYVNPDDVDFIVDEYQDILELDISNFEFGSKVWVGNENNTWNIYTAIRTELEIESIESSESGYDLFIKTTNWDFDIDEIVGVYNLDNLDGFYKIEDIENNKISIQSESSGLPDLDQINGKIIRLVSSRFINPTEVCENTKIINQGLDRLWIDNTSNAWRVIDKNAAFSEHQTIESNSEKSFSYGSSIDSNRNNTVLAVGDPDNENGKVYIYTRTNNSGSYKLATTLEIDNEIADSDAGFGTSVAVSHNGDFVAVGSPKASNVRTRFSGIFSEDRDYAEGSIVQLNDNLWVSVTDILGSAEQVQFGSYESVVQILLELGITGETDTNIPVLLAGNYPFDNQTADHFLVKAPRDMYDGSSVGDQIKLKWNTLSYAYQDNESLEITEPFSGTISQLDSDFITDNHVIAEKIDCILYVNSATNVPNVGQTVETQTASGTVAYVYNDRSEIAIYVKDQNGDFDLAGSITTDIGEFVGEYELEVPREQAAGIQEYWRGFWKIDLGNEYDVLDVINDDGRGLVYTDLIPQGETGADIPYFNVLDFEADAFSSFDTRHTEIGNLTYEGLSGPGGVTGVFESDLYFLRAPKPLTDELSQGENIEVFYNNLPNYETGDFIDTEEIGLSIEELNRNHQIFDLWDGYIDYRITRFFSDGSPIEPRVGITVQDITNEGTAEVAFYQKFDSLNARIYVKNVSGVWAEGRLFGENREIQFLGDGSNTDFGVNRVFGQIESRSLGYAAGDIGKLIVFQTEDRQNIDLQEKNKITIKVSDDPRDDDELPDTEIIATPEYWFYREETIDGAPREPNIPADNNNDWRQVYRIPTDSAGNPGPFENEGIFTVYQRTGTSQYTKINNFVVPQRESNARLGEDVKFAEINNVTKLFVKSRGGNDSENYGRIFVIKNGEENGNQYSWELGLDKQYTGEFTNQRDYSRDNVVFVDQESDDVDRGLYRARTNVPADEFDIEDWIFIDEPIDYLGYIPNNQDLVLDGFSTITDIDNLTEFSRDFDVSQNGEILVTSSFYNDSQPNRLVVYRNQNGLYVKDQEIEAPNNTDDYGNSISISRDGMFVAVGAPLDDTNGINQGAVYVYQQINGDFELNQILTSSNDDKNEQFGYRVAFNRDTLAVSSRNGDSFSEAVFDNGSTTFDGKFTKFRDYADDVGIIQIYELFDNSFLYAQTIDFDDSGVRYFGRNIHIENNHIYVGMPRLELSGNNQGTVVDYKKSQNDSLWRELRTIKPTVDVDKIKRVSLYDTRKNELIQYLDYIDPLQGKVAGIAEQEIFYKLYYDPAVYTEGTGVQVDRTNSWGKEQVGKIWWDLTNTKFLNPYQNNIIYSSNNWNSLFSDLNSVDVYEWVESTILPSEWDRLSGTEQGFTRGITGTTRYSDLAYVAKRIYNKLSQTFSVRYYYWVRNKSTVPNVENRTVSAQDIADLIRNPQGEGYRYVSLISPTEFALYNCESLVKDRDVAISFQYYIIEDQSINIHNQYQILTDGLASSRPNRDVEQKWFDSLVGYDLSRRQVPAPELSAKEKYGILNTPRQGWFVNRTEALKETVDRINRVLAEYLIVDEKDISRLTESEKPPLETSRLYDRTVESELDLQFVGVARARQAKLSVQTENGRLTRVDIVDPGRGYLVAPTVSVLGTGTGAEIAVEIDNQGRITTAEVVEAGEYYQDNTPVSVRRFTVLVENDSTLDGRWALYERNAQSREWIRTQSQGFDVQKYWEYRDWYEQDYGKFTDIDHLIDASFELQSLDDEIGDIVKIQNIGSGGWLLLEKINDEDSVDYTVNYKTIGRYYGTIQFKESLYDISQNLSGFDTTSFDSKNFDGLPTIETRIILETVRDSIFTDDLEIEYNRLFFASLRYVFSEQNFVDWAFKTSFIKAQHNVGELKQKISFQNDSLPSYEDYVREVKPYSANIREYLSTYENLDNSRSMTTDFDLPPRYDFLNNSISPLSTSVEDNSVTVEGNIINSYPDLHWLDNVGFSVESITVSDKGQGYTSAPAISLIGGGGTGAKARASIGTNGVLSQITVTDKGEGYISAPEVVINGSLAEDGKDARAIARIGGSPIRNMYSVIKFDRVSGEFEFVNLRTVEQFAGTGNRLEYDLEWPMDLRTTRVRVFVNGSEALGGLYTYENVLDTSKGYDRKQGKIIFNQAPSNGALIEVEYFKSIDLLKAQDRINSEYDPTVGKLGKSLSQLMTGIDYGGVEVTSFGFESTSGWDSQPWSANFWDVFDSDFEDEIFVTKQVTLTFDSPVDIQVGTTLIQDSTGARGRVKNSIDETTVVVECDILEQFDTSDVLRLDDSSLLLGVDSTVSVLIETTTGEFVLDNPLETNTVYNVYKVGRDSQGNIVSNVRLDDPNYGTSSQINENAIIQSITGDGSTSVLSFDELDLQEIQKLPQEELITIIIRKIDSDGSFIPDPESYDTKLTGGDLAYQTATGLRAEDINIDGDGFVTPTTSKGPEEVVPGQVLDTLDMRVYETPVDGRSRITTRNYVANGIDSVYNSGTVPVKSDNVFVKVDNIIQDAESYQIDYRTGDVVLDSVPSENARINITTLGNSGSQILDIDSYTGDGQTGEFLTNVKYAENIDAFVTVNGKETSYQILESTSDYDVEGNVVIKFTRPPASNSAINIMLVTEGIISQNYSVVEIDDFIADGSSTEFVLENNIFEQQPAQAFTLVKVDDKILNAGYNKLFEVSNLRQYQIDLTQIPVASVSANEIEVYLNGNLLERNSEWNFEGSGVFTVGESQPGSTITLENGIGKPGDELRVYVLTDGDYRFGYFDSANEFVATRGEDSTLPVLHLDEAPESGSTVTVYNFSNHNSQGIERISLEVTEKTPTTPDTKSYFDFRRLERGIVDLRRSAQNVQSVWVIMNNELLTASVDYYLREDKRSIQIVHSTAEGDIIEVLHFADDPVTARFGWRQFKDMLNRTHYKRLSKNYKLAADLKYDDLEILVEDASELPEPDYNTRTPGVLFLNKERIEYFVKDGNTLKQIRRGTLGTGIAHNYPAGTEFMEQGKSHNIPYNDETEIITETAGGYSQGVSEFGNNIGLSIDSISYDFNNNTAFPLGGQVATVTGTGFEENVTVQVGEVECETTYISSTELTFVTPALPVGAYDLVVINPTTNIPVFRPQTSVVGEGLIKYVQILLPFAPLPETENVQNPAETGEWYTEDFDEGGIPDDYWQALDIDVFVGGRRLNKSPAEVYNYEAQDSPEGDKQIEAEFAVNKDLGAYVRLTEPPPKGSTVKIVRKTGTRWSEQGKPLARSETDVARFLQDSTTDLPR